MLCYWYLLCCVLNHHTACMSVFCQLGLIVFIHICSSDKCLYPKTVQFPENHQSNPVYLMSHRRHTCHVSAPRRSAWIRFFIPRCFCLIRERMGGSSDLCKDHVPLHTNAVFQASVITRSFPLMKTTQRELRGPKGEAGTRHDCLEYWSIGFPVSHRVRRLTDPRHISDSLWINCLKRRMRFPF